MEIGADQANPDWPSWISLDGEVYTIYYTIREPTTSERRGYSPLSATAFVREACTELNGQELKAVGETVMQAIETLAESIKVNAGSNATRFAADLPLSARKLSELQRSWNR